MVLRHRGSHCREVHWVFDVWRAAAEYVLEGASLPVVPAVLSVVWEWRFQADYDQCIFPAFFEEHIPEAVFEDVRIVVR